MPWLIAIALSMVVGWWFFRASRKRAAQDQADKLERQVQDSVAQACNYIQRLNTSRSFPVVWMKNVNAKPGEFGLLHETTTLFEHKTKRYTLGAGTRLRVGKIPLYLGGAQHFSYQELEPAADGDLYLTNERVVFISDRKSASVPLKDLIGIEGNPGAIILHSAKRQQPYTFRVANSAQWTMLLKLFSAGYFKVQTLPEGVTITAKAASTPGEVDLEISSQKPLAVSP